MSDIEWMAFNVDDYVTNTMHLTTRQHGAYILLICAAWKAKGVLPGVDAALMATAKLTPKEWREDAPILKAFLTRRGDAWVHERVEFEWKDAQALIAAKSRAGKAGARKRWDGRSNGAAMADASQEQRQSDAPSPEPVPNPPASKNLCVSQSAPVGATHTKLLMDWEGWKPSAAAIEALRTTHPWLTGDMFDARQRDFADWCRSHAVTSSDPDSTWSSFMRKTHAPKVAAVGSKAAKSDILPPDDRWGARMKGWRERKFWVRDWGPRPGEAGCWVPREFLDPSPRYSATEAA
jgi:uncharacterized protein YdaU (DUF1376 family)